MPNQSPQVAYYLEQFREGAADSAFFGLMEADRQILPELMDVYRCETDAQTRQFLVEIIWQHRNHSTIAFLAEALNDQNADVWKTAIDGLVVLSSTGSRAALEAAKSREFSRANDAETFRQWLDEAIEQVDAELRKTPSLS